MINSNVAIIGLGLIGGSLALALRNSPQVQQITGIDIDRYTLEKALAIDAIDKAMDLEEGVQEADLVILACPLKFYKDIITRISPYLKPGCIITDVGSTKNMVMSLMDSLLPPHVFLVGGHPMAGAEKKGIEGADAYMFENAVYILTPAPSVPREKVYLLESILEATGAKIKVLEPDQHDEIVAAVSHIPHIAAAALVNLIAKDPYKLILAAGGFRDTTRIASSNPDIWEDIILSNQEHVLKNLLQLNLEIEGFIKTVQDRDRKRLRFLLEEAKAVRDKIPANRKGLLEEFAELVCIVPDKPGIIGILGSTMARFNINIVDIEILRVREGDGGTIRLGVKTSQEARQAVAALQEIGIKAWVR